MPHPHGALAALKLHLYLACLTVGSPYLQPFKLSCSEGGLGIVTSDDQLQGFLLCADACMHMGKPDCALVLLDKAVERFAHTPHDVQRIAAVACRWSRWPSLREVASRLYRRVVKALHEQGNPHASLDALRKLTELDSTDPSVRVALAEALITSGATTEGLEHWQIALENARNASELDAYLKLLEQLVRSYRRSADPHTKPLIRSELALLAQECEVRRTPDALTRITGLLDSPCLTSGEVETRGMPTPDHGTGDLRRQLNGMLLRPARSDGLRPLSPVPSQPPSAAPALPEAAAATPSVPLAAKVIHLEDQVPLESDGQRRAPKPTAPQGPKSLQRPVQVKASARPPQWADTTPEFGHRPQPHPATPWRRPSINGTRTVAEFLDAESGYRRKPQELWVLAHPSHNATTRLQHLARIVDPYQIKLQRVQGLHGFTTSLTTGGTPSRTFLVGLCHSFLHSSTKMRDLLTLYHSSWFSERVLLVTLDGTALDQSTCSQIRRHWHLQRDQALCVRKPISPQDAYKHAESAKLFNAIADLFTPARVAVLQSRCLPLAWDSDTGAHHLVEAIVHDLSRRPAAHASRTTY